MSQTPDTAGYLHQEVLKKARYLVVTVDKYGLVVKQECPGIQWRFDSIRTGRTLPDALQSILDSCTDSLAPQLFPYVHLSDDLIADIHVLNRGEDRQLILQDVSHGHDDEHRLQQKAHEVSLLLEQQAQLNRLLDEKHQQAQQASQAKSRFIAAMSHEFRSPITSIMAHSESLADRMPGEREPGAILRASWYLLTLVENLLEHARMGEGGSRLDISAVDGKRVVMDTGELFAAQAAAAGLELEVSCDSDSCSVLADELRLRQVLINLLSNALRYTRSGSVKLALEAGPDKARISVSDTGIGIAAEQFDTIFQPFRQLDANSQGGAGLGLSISSQLVRDMGGSLEVRSAEGEGSEFFFDLPVAADAADEDSLEGRKVLLVEDDEDISSIYQIWL
ncbi:MAG: HAMP domain-containing histidine kinase, partial [Xanthomonadales bacterium]|nr:HAMP domain-containing histidine kinase [Xanthomonadales bacterium]